MVKFFIRILLIILHLFQVLEAIFSYVNMLRKIGPSERIFEEIKVSAYFLPTSKEKIMNL